MRQRTTKAQRKEIARTVTRHLNLTVGLSIDQVGQIIEPQLWPPAGSQIDGYDPHLRPLIRRAVLREYRMLYSWSGDHAAQVNPPSPRR